MNEEYEDNFTNGIFWELYKDLEHQFEEFLEYVPYFEGNEATYSPKLLNLILGIGGHIDSVFKEMARYPRFASNEPCRKILRKLEEGGLRTQSGKPPEPIPMKLCLEAFEAEYRLSKKYVVFKRHRLPHIIIPFRTWSSKRVPEWWNTYNSLKHDVGTNIRRANLNNAMETLAGAFLLNAIHIPSFIRLYQYEFIKPIRPIAKEISSGPELRFYLAGNWREKLRNHYEKSKRFRGVAETSLFAYAYDAEAGNWDDFF